jgi:hypothetical protein
MEAKNQPTSKEGTKEENGTSWENWENSTLSIVSNRIK